MLKTRDKKSIFAYSIIALVVMMLYSGISTAQDTLAVQQDSTIVLQDSLKTDSLKVSVNKRELRYQTRMKRRLSAIA